MGDGLKKVAAACGGLTVKDRHGNTASYNGDGCRTDIKQVIAVRTDLKLRKGQMCAQVAHASMKVILDRLEHDERERCFSLHCHEDWGNYYEAVYPWLTGTFTKVVVRCGSEGEIRALAAQAAQTRVPFAIVQESGFDTPTAIALGPALAEDLDPITGEMKLL